MKNRYAFNILSSMLLSAILLAGCNSENTGAENVIKAYIQALSEKDSDQISILSCADWEQNAIIEVDSFTNIGSQLKNLECNQIGQEAGDVFVSCTGVLQLDYDGEDQQIDLSDRTYIARQDGDDWRMCGYR